jgi:hypothetical protein
MHILSLTCLPGTCLETRSFFFVLFIGYIIYNLKPQPRQEEQEQEFSQEK